ncbi:MAG: hypothetical protein DRQ88_13305 [Epsilonproteobacteria bacterium]|nr:MAG: hypothetical protein DRQ88_13305 [Campylobacterota bacterium]
MATRDIDNIEGMLRKTASLLTNISGQNQTFMKERRATELLYKQASIGKIVFPQTFEEYQEKVAELMGKDLDIIEEAIKLASEYTQENSLGATSDVRSGAIKPSEVFKQHLISDF